MELSSGTFRIQVDDVLAKGDRVVVLCTESAQRGGRSWSSPQVHVFAWCPGRQYQQTRQSHRPILSAILLGDRFGLPSGVTVAT
jgi:hypothetical protein